MITRLTPTIVSTAFVDACLAELQALKPGNVHVFSAGHGMETRHFEAAARAAAPLIADPALSLGERINAAVGASFEVANCNTNLGIILLTVPLAAASLAPDGGDLRARLAKILDHLTIEDATHTFRAISRANPAGLGQVKTGDVAKPAELTLRAAMALSADRDRIGRAYTDNFADIFELGLPKFQAALKSGVSETWATTRLHMTYLATFADSHIVRKHGPKAAEGVRQEAENYLEFSDCTESETAHDALLAFDLSLKDRGLNPGTTADFVVATLFARDLIFRAASPHAE